MRNLIKWFSEISESLTSSLFWEDGKIMFTFCIVITGIFIIVLALVTNGFRQLNWKIWLPAVVCIPIIILCLIMTFFPNGTGGVTQHFYLGILMYTLCILIFTSVAEGIIIVFLKLLR